MMQLDAPEISAATGPANRARRWLKGIGTGVVLACLTALVFGATLVMTMPASVVRTLVVLPPQVETLSGSLSRGRAGLMGGYTLDWTWSPRELITGRIAVGIELQGSDTRLEGRVEAVPFAVTARDLRGRAGAGLLALFPRLAVEGCNPRAVVAIDSLSAGRRGFGARGMVETSQGICLDRNGNEIPVPAMVMGLSTEGADANAILSDDKGTTLARLAVTGDRILRVTVEPQGAALVPGMPSSAATSLALPF